MDFFFGFSGTKKKRKSLNYKYNLPKIYHALYNLIKHMEINMNVLAFY